MNYQNNYNNGKSKPDSTGSGKSIATSSTLFTVFWEAVESGVLPLSDSCLIVITENTSINKIPDSNAAIGIIHPSPLTVDIPAKAITNNDAPSNKMYLELPVIL